MNPDKKMGTGLRDMEMIEPVFVSDHQFSVVGPTFLEEGEAKAFLSGYLSLWHPVVLARAVALPRISNSLDLSEPVAKTLAVVADKTHFEKLQAEFLSQHNEKGWAIWSGEGDSVSHIVSLFMNSLECQASSPDQGAMNPREDGLLSAFKGVGLGLAWVDAVFESQNHADLLNRGGLLGACREAAQLWVQGRLEYVRPKLVEAAEFLTQAREQVIGGTPRILESADWDHLEDGIQPDLPEGNRYGLKCGVFASGQALQKARKAGSKIIDQLRASKELVQVCGGRYFARLDGHLPIASQLWNLRKGQQVHQDILGGFCQIVVHPGDDLHPGLPSLWRQAGFSHAVLCLGLSGSDSSALDDLNRRTRVSIVSWSSGDGMGVETLVRQPLDGTSSKACIDLAYHFQRSQSIDYCPVLHLRSPVIRGSEWFEDFLALCALSPVLGIHCLPDELLKSASPGDYWSAATADELMPDPVGFLSDSPTKLPWPEMRSQRQRIQADWAFTSILASLEGCAPSTSEKNSDWIQASKSTEEIEEYWEAVAVKTGRVESFSAINLPAELLAKRILLRGKENTPGWLVLNPCSFTRRGILKIPGTRPFKPEGPVRASQVETDGTLSTVVEVPAYGFCWLPREGDGVAGGNGVHRTRLADEKGVRNEFLEADIDPSTGEIRSIKDTRSRGPRISIQVVGQKGTAMVQKKSRLVSHGPARGELEIEGELVDGAGQKVGEFFLGLKAWLGRPVLEIGAHLSFVSGDTSELGNLRVVWRDPSVELRRGWMGQGYRLNEGLQVSGDWIEIAEAAQATTTLLPVDFPVCKRHGKRTLDFPLGRAGKENGEMHRMGIALDRDYPFLLAQGLESPLPCLAVDRGPPPSGPAGWLGLFDHSDVLVTDVRPCEISGKKALNWQLISTSKEGFELGFSLAKLIKWGSGVDLVGREQRSVNLNDGTVQFFMQRMEWAGLAVGLD